MRAEDGGEPITPRTVAALLAPTLGWEKSEEAVTDAMRRRGVSGAVLTPEQRLEILEEIAHEPGIVGVTARFVRSRLSWYGGPGAGPSSCLRPVAAAASLPPPSSRRRPSLAISEIVPLLAHTIGYEKSEEAIVASARRLRLPTDRLERDQAALVFDDLARQEGLVGVTARFAKARLFLKYG
jgi:hypothetical protein